MPRHRTRPFTLLLTLVALGALWSAPRVGEWLGRMPVLADQAQPSTTPDAGADRIRQAFTDRQSSFMVSVSGTVVRTLADDREGSRHQRFVLELANELTLLVAHNIDLAPRVPLETGDRVELRGEYEWNPQGGVMHWTHHDPDGTHEPGWILHEGRKYQ